MTKRAGRLFNYLHATQALWLGLAVLLLGMGLSQLAPWRHLMLKEFDLLTWLNAPNVQRFPIVIVGIDDNSTQVIGQRWPWPRHLHAQLIDALTRRGAQLIAFDAVFDTAGDEAGDAAFEAAIRRSGRVVLADDVILDKRPYGDIWIHQQPLPRFVAAGAATGSINVQIDDDQTLRRRPQAPDAIWRVLARRVASATGLPYQPSGDYLRYLGRGQTFPYISYYQALEPDRYQPKFDFHNTLVLVGRTGATASDVGARQNDQFQTPFTAIDQQQFMPGVEFQANLIETALGGAPLYAVPVWLERLLPVVAVLLLIAAGWRLRLRQPAIALALLWLLLPALGQGLFAYGEHWLPVLPALLASTATFIGLGALTLRQASRERYTIRSMFSRYVPEKVVNQLIGKPGSLVLGGEQQQITLIFSDLEGFSDLAEALRPDEVGTLLNDYFLRMTEVIFALDGTLDKFIGDAIMAFWGAPLRDPDQAAKAIACARAMQGAMVALNLERCAQGKPALRMRIGLHSGHAVVGNLGSPKRFNYTAVGDAVNLAARLEGANKYYGTAILYSEDTMLMAGGSGHRRVDTVRVRGRRVPVTLYTPCDDASLLAASEIAFASYAVGNWQIAQQHWHALLSHWPDDPVAQVMHRRAAAFRTNPPAAHWDGAWLLDIK
jgi:adenylate cyclase